MARLKNPTRKAPSFPRRVRKTNKSVRGAITKHSKKIGRPKKRSKK